MTKAWQCLLSLSFRLTLNIRLTVVYPADCKNIGGSLGSLAPRKLISGSDFKQGMLK